MLPMLGDLSVAREGRQNALVAKVLAPGFEFFACSAQEFAQASKG
jgi:hypothetical protein